MRILYVIAMYGSEYLGNLIHRELAHEFIAHGHTVEVFAFASANDRTPPGDAVEQGIPVHRALTAGDTPHDALNSLGKPIWHYDRFASGWLALRRFLNRQPHYDVIFAEGAYPFGALCALAGAHDNLVITVAGGDFINSPDTAYGYGRYRTARHLMRSAFQQAAAVRVTTPLVRDRAFALGADPARTHLIPRNIATYCYPPVDISLDSFRAQSRADLAARYNLGSAHLIAAVGRLLPIKGFDTLLRALPQVLETVGDTRLLLVGPNRVDPQFGDYQAHLTTLARELGITDKVVFTGAIQHPDMRAYLAAADLVAIPSVLEGMNKVAVEAAAVGTPSVVTRTSGIADLLRDAQAGEIVPENSPPDLAHAIRRILCNPSLAAGYRSRGLLFADEFTTPRVSAQLLALFRQV